MDAPTAAELLHVPRNLPRLRVARWCLQRTLHDVRRSIARGRPMPTHTALRLLERRWWRAHPHGPALPSVVRQDTSRGIERLRKSV